MWKWVKDGRRKDKRNEINIVSSKALITNSWSHIAPYTLYRVLYPVFFVTMNVSGHLQLILKLRKCGVSLHSAHTRTSSWSGATEQKKYRRYPPPILHHLHHHRHLQWFVLDSLPKNSTHYFFFNFLVYIFHSGISKFTGKIFQQICFQPLCSVR